jgi:6,7-dimethyl-8-ribityllumazine synthase
MPNIAIVLGAFHKKEAEEMLDEARKTAAEHGLTIVEEIWVHGSIEKPLALKRLLMRDVVDGCVALGIIERGQTKHGLVMGEVVYDAIIRLMLEFMKPIGLGILGPEILPEQIPPRVRPYAREAVIATAQMLGVTEAHR